MSIKAKRRAKEVGINDATFYTFGLESVSGKYNTVICVDVAIHYLVEKMSEMVGYLWYFVDDRIIISFAPDTSYYSILKKVGKFFPGPSKTTSAYLHKEDIVCEAVAEAGFEIVRNEITGTTFYFLRLLKAKCVKLNVNDLFLMS